MGATWKRESPFHKVLDLILCLRGILLACYAAKSRERADSKARGSLSDYNAPLCLDCLLNTRKNSTVRPRDFADDHAPLVFEAIETIIWKLPIAPVVRIFSKYFETSGPIRTIIWKPGLRYGKTLITKGMVDIVCFGFSLCVGEVGVRV